MARFLLCFLLLTIQACAPAGGTIAPPDVQMVRDVYWLADDAREGRLVGTPGADAAAEYIAQRFRDLDLAPLPLSGAYRQTFTMPGRTTIRTGTSLSAGNEKFLLDRDFVPYPFSAIASFTGKPAFVGYGAVSKAHQYDDYANVDVKGRVAIAMRYEPHDAIGRSRFTGFGFTYAATLAAKARAAHVRGATALLLVRPPNHHGSEPALSQFVVEGSRFIESPIPVLSITPAAAERLIGHRLAPLQQLIDDSGKPASFTVDAPAITGRVDLEVEQVRAANVGAVLRGTGPLADEYIVLAAHYDHLGHGQFGSRGAGSRAIHNGADDNASGVAAMLAVAQQLKVNPPARSILFLAFSGEEEGLFGSRAFFKDPPAPIGKIVAMINLDMVGRVRGQTLFIAGSGTRDDFGKMLAGTDRDSPLNLHNIGRGGLGPSDHQAFAMHRIPVLFLFSGYHPQYHHPDDDAHRINFAGLEDVVKLTADLIRRLATAPRLPYVDRFDGESERVHLDPPD